MRKMKSAMTIVLAMVMLMCAIGASAESGMPLRYALGDQIKDFSFTTYDGERITLSDVLKEKEAVLINIWATWCGPCRNEFPFLQEAYERYQDKVEVIALSCEPTDTANVLASFAAAMGLTFKIGQDPVDFLSALGIGSIPTTLMVDRFGTICFIESGSQPNVNAFVRLFEAFLGDDYTESVLLTDIPPMKPNVTPSSEVELSAALNADGAAIAFSNDKGAYSWPMIVCDKDGRSVVASTNQGMPSSESLVKAVVSANADDAIVVAFKVSSQAGCDVMQLRINNEVVKSFGGEKDWMTYAYQVPVDGEYAVTVAYVSDQASAVGEDTLWVDSIAVLSGDEAAAAVAANPSYPVSEQLAISVLNGSAKEVLFTDPTGMIAVYYGAGPFYLVPDDVVNFALELPAEYDPEVAMVSFNYDGSVYALAECIVDGRYIASSGTDSIDSTGYCDSTVFLYPDLVNYQQGRSLTYFKSEENVDAFVRSLTTTSAGNTLGSWKYADNGASAKISADAMNADPGVSAYTLKCIDQNGAPVPGVMLQICDAETCQVVISDADGMYAFTAAPYAWEIHILRAPEGYTADSTDVVLAPVEGGELVFTLTKN